MKKIYVETRLVRTAAFLFFLQLGLLANATIYPIHNLYSGAQENPPNGSAGKAAIVGSYDDQTNTLSFSIIFSGLTSNTVAAHFHAPAPPGVNAPIVIPYTGFPLGVTQGTYTSSVVLTEFQ